MSRGVFGALEMTRQGGYMATGKKEYDAFDWQALKFGPVIGVDEVGRGCLAGDVYAAACVLDPQKSWSHYTDSKKLTPKKREHLCEEILRHHRVEVGIASVSEIDQMNILKAALLAMRRAVESLGFLEGTVLVDGTFKITDLSSSFRQITLVKGDLRAAPVAAASIVAKVTRDRDVSALDDMYPGYGFAKHKGYSTKLHKDAIAQLGVLPVHRTSFAGVKEYV